MATELQKTWEERLNRAHKEYDDWKTQFKVDTGIAYFEGQSNPGFPENEWININKIYSHLQTQLPKLYGVDPYFYVKPKRSFKVGLEDDAAQMIAQMTVKARGRQAALNYYKSELELKVKARLAIQDAHFSFGVLHVRRASELKEHPNAGQPIVDEDNNELTGDNGEPLLYPDELPVNEKYSLERVHPDDFRFDCDAGPLQDSWSWLGFRTQMTKKEALEDRRFKRANVEKIQAKKREGEKEPTGAFSRFIANKKDDEEDIVDIWTIYDLKKREWLMVAENGHDLLIKPRNTPPGVEDHAFAILRFTLRDKSPYPIPPVFNAIDPQREMSLSRSMMLRHRKRFNRKYIAVMSKFEDEDIALEQLESGDDGTIIRAIANGAIEAIKDAPLDQTNLVELGFMQNDIIEAMGTPDPARGIGSADSATEAGIMDARLGLREGDRMGQVIDFVLDAAKKLDKLIQFHMDRDEAVKVTGPQGDEWVTIKKGDYEEIEGDYEYAVNVGATQPRLPDVERAQFTAFWSQVIIPMPAILTKRALLKQVAALYHIEDDAVIEAMIELGKELMSGQLPMPGNQGGGPSNNPLAQIMGMAGGAAGGNANGGGNA